MVGGNQLRVVFFGTPEFAMPTLEALLRSHHPVVGVVTRPDRPRDRGQKTIAAPVKKRAAAVVAEAMVAFVLADAAIEKFGGDSIEELVENWRAFRERTASRFVKP